MSMPAPESGVINTTRPRIRPVGLTPTPAAVTAEGKSGRGISSSRRRCGAPRLAQAGEDGVAVEAHLHQRDLRFVDIARDLIADFRLEHVEDGEPQRDSGQWARVGGIAGDN